MGLLEITTAAGDRDPVIKLSGECDVSVAGQLSDAVEAQISGGAQHLVVDLSELRFADSASIRVLVQGHRTLAARGGGLELVFPQPVVAAALSLLGVDQVLTVRTRPGAETTAPGSDALLRMITGVTRW